MEEALTPGASVAEVARRHGVNANLLFKWLRMAGRRRPSEMPEAPAAEDVVPPPRWSSCLWGCTRGTTGRAMRR
jgi:transposase-like protein